jgi:hypothetical protein
MASTPTPHTLKTMPRWRDDDEADRWLQSANLNEYDLKGESLVDWLERQEGPTVETLHSDLGQIIECLTALSNEVRTLEQSVRELGETQRRRRAGAAGRAKAAAAGRRTPTARSKAHSPAK